MIRSDGLLLNYKLCKDVKEVVGEMYRSSKNPFIHVTRCNAYSGSFLRLLSY